VVNDKDLKSISFSGNKVGGSQHANKMGKAKFIDFSTATNMNSGINGGNIGQSTASDAIVMVPDTFEGYIHYLHPTTKIYYETN
jgi:hypothetical protein